MFICAKPSDAYMSANLHMPIFFRQINQIIKMETMKCMRIASLKPLTALRNRIRATWPMLGIVFLFLNADFANAKGNEMTISRMSISPNGQLISFQVRNAAPGAALGLFDRASGETRFVPEVAGTRLRDANFTPDGKGLLALAVRQTEVHVVEIRLDSLQATELFKLPTNGRTWYEPTQSPDGKSVLLVAGNPYLLIAFDRASGRELGPAGEAATFKHAIGRPYFVGRDEILFEGMGALDSVLQRQAEELGIRDSDSAAYRMKLGGRPELTLREQARKSNGVAGILSISAAADGSRMAFIGLSSAQPRNSAGAFNWEIFIAQGQDVRQRTDLQNYLSSAQISANGNAVLFSMASNDDSKSNPRHDGLHPQVLDLVSGKVTAVPVATHLQQQAPIPITGN